MMALKNRTKYDEFSFSTGLYLSLECGASLGEPIALSVTRYRTKCVASSFPLAQVSFYEDKKDIIRIYIYIWRDRRARQQNVNFGTTIATCTGHIM